MMPLGEEGPPTRTVPIVTYLLIVINILVFLMEMSGGEEAIMKWAFIPARFLQNPPTEFATIFSAMFMHAGWFHLGGNMLYLWIFGRHVEDSFGKLQYLFFYLICGIAATFSQLMFTTQSSIPNVGASGAIAGILGAYILMFPKEKIRVLVGQIITVMPAIVVIGIWFLLQFMSELSTFSGTEEEGGVAYMAHIGGFLSGLVLAFLFVGFRKTY